jgi:hypothetical protein
MSTFRTDSTETIATPAFEKVGEFFKVDDDLGIAYGWAIVSTENGKPYFDLQGDHIPEEVMVEALFDFSKNSRVGKDMHAGDQTGEHVFIYPMTKATMSGLGITGEKTGAIVGYKPTNKADLAQIKSGARTGFSIGGVLIASDETEVGKTLRKGYAATSDGKKKGRVFRTFKIHEISLVDRPAQEGATVGVVKRVLAEHDLAKACKLTSAEKGHQHVVWLDDLGKGDHHTTTYDYSAGAEDSHNHRIVVEGNKVVLSMNAGHTHELELPRGWRPRAAEPVAADAAPGVSVVVMNAPPSTEKQHGDLTSPITTASVSSSTNHQEPQMTPEQIADLNARLERATKMAELTDSQKLYFGKLAPADQSAFLAKSAADRSKEVETAVVHKGEDGTLYFTTDDPRLVSLVKTNESLAKAATTANQHRLDAEAVVVAKSHLGNCSGTDDVKLAVVKALNTIGDETVRKAAFELLKAADAAVNNLGKSAGHNVVGNTPSNAESAFYEKRDTFAKASNLPLGTDAEKAVATRKFMQTQEGAALYRDYVAGQPARA